MKTLVTLAASLFALSAHGAIVVNNTGASPVCSVSEVQLPAGTNSDYCLGYFTLPNFNPTTEGNFLNDRTDGADWDFVYRTPTGENALFGGLSFSLTFTPDGSTADNNDGTWTVSWSDTNGTDPLNLPTNLDLAFAFKAGQDIAWFLFDDFLLTDDPYSAGGSFNLSVNGGLSHESMFVRLGDSPPPPPPPGQVPEPGSLALLGLGLAGLALYRRRRFA